MRKYPKGVDSRSRLWTIFRSMHMRCEKPSHAAFPRYGGRGITICKEWSHNFAGFSAWALASGYADSLTLDRIDNDKGYAPSNCRWATTAEQSRNRSDSILVSAFGETKPACDWLSDPRCKANYKQIYRRLKTGHSPEFALTATETEVRSVSSKIREAAHRASGHKKSGAPA